jgi:hypothetical protein
LLTSVEHRRSVEKQQMKVTDDEMREMCLAIHPWFVRNVEDSPLRSKIWNHDHEHDDDDIIWSPSWRIHTQRMDSQRQVGNGGNPARIRSRLGDHSEAC